jgi:hypothetical protein
VIGRAIGRVVVDEHGFLSTPTSSRSSWSIKGPKLSRSLRLGATMVSSGPASDGARCGAAVRRVLDPRPGSLGDNGRGQSVHLNSSSSEDRVIKRGRNPAEKA